VLTPEFKHAVESFLAVHSPAVARPGRS